jgi:RNA polymerase-interacting CarD/CdnL/TRCF family regulator
MAKKQPKYASGDWVVHCYHGVGRIIATERMQVGDQENTYFRMEQPDGTIWIPAALIDGEQVRPLSKQADFRQAIEVLSREPIEMNSIMNLRKLRISKDIAENTPVATARLVRDLWARQREKGMLNDSERRALQDLRSRLVQEWAVCMGMHIMQARRELEQTLSNTRPLVFDEGEKRSTKKSGNEQASGNTLISEDEKWAQWLDQQGIDVPWNGGP